jgi:hypothetical protein
MNLIFAILLVIGASWLLAHIFTMWLVLSRGSSSTIEELRYLQGKYSNVKCGQLEHPPQSNDYRVIRGLEWGTTGYVSQSRLSVEAIKSAYFSK